MAAAGITAAAEAASSSSAAPSPAATASVDLKQRYIKGMATIGAGLLFAYFPFKVVSKTVVKLFGNSPAEVAALEASIASLRSMSWAKRATRLAAFPQIPTVASMETLMGVQALPKRFLYLGNTPVEHRVAYTSLTADQISRATLGHANDAAARALVLATTGVCGVGLATVLLAYYGFGIKSADQMNAAIYRVMPWNDDLTAKSKAFVASVAK